MPGSRYPLLAVTVTCRCDSDSEPPGRYASEKLKGPEILDGIDSRRNSNPIHDIRELESARGRSNVAGPQCCQSQEALVRRRHRSRQAAMSFQVASSSLSDLPRPSVGEPGLFPGRLSYPSRLPLPGQCVAAAAAALETAVTAQ